MRSARVRRAELHRVLEHGGVHPRGAGGWRGLEERGGEVWSSGSQRPGDVGEAAAGRNDGTGRDEG